MSKVWEETWRADNKHYPQDVFSADGGAEVVFEGCNGSERARLAAAAPEMARLLLELEWEGRGGWEGDIPACPSCRGCHERYASDYWVQRYGRVGHAEGCKLVAVLRKAGVR